MDSRQRFTATTSTYDTHRPAYPECCSPTLVPLPYLFVIYVYSVVL